MVDAIKYGSTRPPATGPSGTKELADRKVAPSLTASSAPVVAADTSELSSKAAAAAMRDHPPVDIEAVTRIKEAIARGNYPIDLDSIAERLMDSYRQLKG
jgi:negative regulator of flagellin synthesis FlgM